MRLRYPALLLLLFAVAAASPAADRPVVAVSVAPQREIVARLAGDAVEIVTLVPPGADVETFAPTVQQIAALERAALVFSVGDPGFTLEARLVEPWLERRRHVVRVALADHRRGRPGSAPAAAPGAAHADPHLWVSPRIVRSAAAELAVRLARLLPGEAAAIRTRSVALTADIVALEARLAARLGGGGRFLIDHPSLGHLASDYGLEQIAIEREGREPTPTELARLVARARRDKFRIVLTQRNVARRGAEVLAREIGAELVEVDPLAPDWLANLDRIGEILARALVRD
jgi:zinc transport system substrate-binding protein